MAHELPSNETMAAKNFSLSKTDKTRLRSARTFVEESTMPHQPKISAHKMHQHNRSVISNHDKRMANQDKEITLLGRKAQLQALAELRQRENNTV